MLPADGTDASISYAQVAQHDLYIVYASWHFAVICSIFVDSEFATNIDMAPELEVTSRSDKRVFPPLYVPTGDISKDRLAFIHILERLKVKKKKILLFNSQVDNQVLRVLVRRRKEQDGLSTMYAVKTLL